MNSTAPLAQQSSCLQIKGSLLPLTVLELLYFNPTQLSSDLLAKVTQAPDFFKDLPVVIGLSKFDESKGAINFNELMSICNTLSIKPVALRGGSEIQQLAAKSAGLAYMPAQKERSEPSTLQDLTSDTSQASISSSTSSISTETENTQTQQKEDQPTLVEASPEISETDANISETDTKTAEAQPQTSRIIYQPVRSGQQIYAQNGDLIILGPVGAGAEVLADGNIHVYGPLRGRALAGVRGNTEARIFCYSLEAELVSIAGQYKISEDLQTDNWKKPTQINLVDEKLTLKPLVG